MAARFGGHGMPQSNPTFNRLTSKLLCESHLRWGTFRPNLGTLGLWVLELFAVRDGRSDGQTDRRTDGQTKGTIIAPFPTVRGITIKSDKNVPHLSFVNVCFRLPSRRRISGSAEFLPPPKSAGEITAAVNSVEFVKFASRRKNFG